MGRAASGEIDIMEYRGQVNNTILGTIQYGAQWPNNAALGSGATAFPYDFSANYHIFGLQWNKTTISWLVTESPTSPQMSTEICLPVPRIQRLDSHLISPFSGY